MAFLKKCLSSFLIIGLVGLNSFTAKKVEAAGEEITATIDYTETADRSPELHGTISDPGQYWVTVYFGEGVDSTTEAENGVWSIPKGELQRLPNGIYDVELVVYDSNMTEVLFDETFLQILKIEDNQTDTPAFEIDAQVDMSNFHNFIVRGSAEPYSEIGIEITDEFGNMTGGYAIVEPDGNFESNPIDLATLWDGELTIKVVVTDDMENVNEATQTIQKEASDLQAPSFELTENVNLSNQENYIISGSGDPGATVYAYISDELGEIVAEEFDVDENGDFDGPLNLSGFSDGTLTFKLGLANSDGELSGFSIDTIEKNTVVAEIEFINDNYLNFDNPSELRVQGVTEPNVEITYHLTDGTDELTDVLFADENGEFDFSIDTSSLPDGDYELFLVTKNSVGNELESEHRSIVKDVTPPESPVIEIEDVNQSNVEAVKFSGISEPGSRVYFVIVDKDDNTIKGDELLADEDGHFEVLLDLSELPDGEAAVYAFSIDENQNSSEEISAIGFIKDTVAPVILEFNSDRETVTAADQLVTLSGTTEPFAYIVLTFTLKGEAILIDTYADENGNFSFEPLDLSISKNGMIKFAVCTMDESGNESAKLEQNVLLSIAGNDANEDPNTTSNTNSGTISTTSTITTTSSDDPTSDTLPLSGLKTILPILISLMLFVPVSMIQRRKSVRK